MTNPRDDVTDDSGLDENSKLEKETVEDLDAATDEEQDVKGGVTTGQGPQCYAGTW